MVIAPLLPGVDGRRLDAAVPFCTADCVLHAATSPTGTTRVLPSR
jgi:hypothetical protein